jgi:chemotaxis protein methyltransferase CheR
MMSLSRESGDVEAIEIRLLLEAVHARYGYDLRDYAPQSMARRLRAALRRAEVAHLGELQHRLLRDPELFANLLDSLTVQVSEPFRDPDIHRRFRQRVVPVLRTYPLLKIWHAGCASGEEVYSMAILLEEEGLEPRTQIHATDVSPHAISTAKEGVYPASILPVFTSNHLASGGTSELASYITVAYDQIAIRQAVRKRILFFQHDLIGDHVFGEMQVIVCRNVLIYFSKQLQERVVKKLMAALCPGGFLCLGPSEQLPRALSSAFTPFDTSAAIYRYEP